MSVLEHVAGNLRRLRQGAGLSQQALAERSGVSRRMLTGIEAGDANVSLNTLDRIAEALGVTFAALVQAPDSAQHRIGAVVWQGAQAGSTGTLLANCPALQGVEMWNWTLQPGERYVTGEAPAPWEEMYFVYEGTLTLELPEGDQPVTAGDFLAFSRPAAGFAYRNDGATPARFVRNVVQ